MEVLVLLFLFRRLVESVSSTVKNTAENSEWDVHIVGNDTMVEMASNVDTKKSKVKNWLRLSCV